MMCFDLPRQQSSPLVVFIGGSRYRSLYWVAEADEAPQPLTGSWEDKCGLAELEKKVSVRIRGPG